jgi:hypothetical protein
MNKKQEQQIRFFDQSKQSHFFSEESDYNEDKVELEEEQEEKTGERDGQDRTTNQVF